MTDLRPEEALRLSEERYRSLIVALAGIVWTTDASGQVTEDQPGWRAFTGQTSEEIEGTGWLAAVHPDSREEAISAWARAVSRTSPYEAEWPLRRRDGEYRCFSIHAAPVRAKNGVVREWVGCNIDITEHKRRDEEIGRLHAQTSAALAQLEQRGRKMQILNNLNDTLQACNSREEAYPFIALAATELFPGTGGALAVSVADARELLETAIEWGGDPLRKCGWMKTEFSTEDCWALRRGGMHEPGPGTVCHHFRTESGGHYACVPLAVRGEASGLFSICFAKTQRMDEEGRSVLSLFGNALALGLSSLQLRETSQQQSVRGTSANTMRVGVVAGVD
jgi:PAS domain S-box-containing protein